MSSISLQDLERNFADVFARVQAGESLVVSQDGRPVAEIIPIAATAPALRPFALAAGEFVVPDDFDEPLPDDLLRGFEGS